MNTKIYWAIALVLAACSACTKENFDPAKVSSIAINPELMIPIGYSHRTIQEYFNDPNRPESLDSTANGLLIISYQEIISSQQATEILDLKLDSINFHLPGFVPVPVKIIEKIDTAFRIQTPINLNGQTGKIRLDSILIKQGVLTLDLNSSAIGKATISIPQLRQGRKSYKQNLDLEIADALVQDLTGWVIVFADDATHDSLTIDLTMTLPAGQTLKPGVEVASLIGAIDNFDYKALVGYVGQHTISTGEQRLDISFYEHILSGAFYFEEPTITFTTTNGYGVPVQAGIRTLIKETKDGDVPIKDPNLPDTAQQDPDRWIIDYPTIRGNIARGEKVLDVSGALGKAFSEQPIAKAFRYSAIGVINPDGDTFTDSTAKAYNFISRNDSFSVALTVDLPIYGWANALLTLDTMAFVFNDFYSGDISIIERMGFVARFANSFPIELQAQIYFADAAYQIIDSLFTEAKYLEGPFIEAGLELPDGRTEVKRTDNIVVEMDKTRIQNLTNTNYLIVKGEINTAGVEFPRSQKFFTDQYIQTRIGVIIELKTNQ